jgi:uncharacterized membrane protein
MYRCFRRAKAKLVNDTLGVDSGGGRRRLLSSIRGTFPRPWQLVVVAAIVGELLVRGPIRALDHSLDLTWHYGAARAWIAGGNPYDGGQVAEAFDRGGGPLEMRPTGPTVYPPLTLPLEAPLGLVGWRTAVVLFAAGTLALVVVALLKLARHAGLTGGRAAVAIFGALALAPLHTGLGMAQVAIPSAALLILGWTLKDGKPGSAGVLLALGAALKPSLALPFLLACALRPTLRLVIAGVATTGALFAIGVTRLYLAGHHGWLGDWLGAVRTSGDPTGMNYARPENLASLPMIHLEMLMWRISSSPALVTAVSLAATVPVLAFAAWRLRVARDRRTELLALSALCVASLLATYHRTYDAFLLAVPLAALVACWREIQRPLRYALIGCFVLFLQPGAPLLHVLAATGIVPAWLSGSTFWHVILIPHHVWALFSVQLILVVVLARLPRTEVAGPQGNAASAPT